MSLDRRRYVDNTKLKSGGINSYRRRHDEGIEHLRK